jgi:hypothetical protein
MMAKRVPVIMERMVRATTTSMRVKAGGLELRIADCGLRFGRRRLIGAIPSGAPLVGGELGAGAWGFMGGRGN